MTAPVVPVDLDDVRLRALEHQPAAKAGPAAAKELEVLFLTQLLRAMRKTIPENDLLPRAPARDVYEGVFDRTVAASMAERDPLGIIRGIGGSGLKVGAQPADTKVGNPPEGTGESHEGRRQERPTGSEA